MLERYDTLETRCPTLGHLVAFRYCRGMDGGPCRRIMQCWSGRIDVRAYLEGRYTEREIADILAPPQPKINQLLELVRKAADEAR
ncbi:MAG TPA: hypothetical protein PLB81_08945 [Deltaproteobacteria bacterium]|nr:hypothetical protein [Deltaproteobacteria bacterium]